MTFTPPDPTAPTYPTARDRVREATGDIDKSINVMLQIPDELIDYWLDTTSEQRTILITVEEILARYARQADVGPRAAGLEATRRFERLLQLRAILKQQEATTVAPGASAGGKGFISAPYLSNAVRTARQADTDLNQGARIRLGMLDADTGD